MVIRYCSRLDSALQSHHTNGRNNNLTMSPAECTSKRAVCTAKLNKDIKVKFAYPLNKSKIYKNLIYYA